MIINNTNDLDYFSNFNISDNINNIKKDNNNNKNIKELDDKDSQDKYKKNKNNFFNYFTKILKIIINIIHLIIMLIYKSVIKLKNYLHRKYGYNNAIRIMIVLGVICFILFYTLFVVLFSSKTKIKENNSDKINSIKNNSVISEEIKKDINDTNIISNITNNNNIINENNRTNITDIKGNNTARQS